MLNPGDPISYTYSTGSKHGRTKYGKVVRIGKNGKAYVRFEDNETGVYKPIESLKKR